MPIDSVATSCRHLFSSMHEAAMADSGHRAERDRLISAALIHESSQNWQHHRHLETQRAHYLGFFFTALLASAGLLTSVAALSRRDDDLLVLGGALLCFILMVISFAIYAAVRKLGAVIRSTTGSFGCCGRDSSPA
ncbi:hypothetical protein V6U81_14610 [Micromonospora sp. CPCC 205711]|uniref:hypothetical protein n=1 Tax=Micromonospora sp. CPCC 205547 TaxID=3122400 RepID=UPI002FF39ED2